MMLAAALCVSGALTALAPPETPPEKLVFTSTTADGKSAGVFLINPDGSKRTGLSKDGTTEIDPALSADGKAVVFVAVSKDGVKADLWVMDADGANRKQLTQNAPKTLVMAPSWSPDGKHIAFTRMVGVSWMFVAGAPGFDPDIVVMDADGKNEKAVGKGMMPVWSPDGKQLLYTQSVKMNTFEPHVAVMDADGQHSQQLENMPSMMAAFSPDGQRIAFVGYPSMMGAAPHVYVANADGSQAAQATKPADGCELGPRWSADGKRIYFSRSLKGGFPQKFAILVMDADGANEQALTNGDGMDLLGGFTLFRLR